MTEVQSLFLVLALIYAWECTHWVRRGAVAFVNLAGRRWRVFHPGAVAGNQQGGVILAQPLPPLGTLTLARQFPLSLSPEAVLAHVAYSVNPVGRPPQGGRCLPWSEIKKIQADFKKVRINGDVWLNVGSAVYAHHVAGQLKTLLALPEEKRAAAIRQMHCAAFDTTALAARWQEVAKRLETVRALANAVFATLFVIAPLVIWRWDLRNVWLPLVLGLLALTVSTAAVFHRHHKALYPFAEDERFTHCIVLALAPAATMRAHELISRPALEAFHPLAAAKVLGTPEMFRRLARHCWREVVHPAQPHCPVETAPAPATEKAARELFQAELKEFLEREQVDVAEFLRVPVATDEACRSYCPRCETQFTTVSGACADCGGIELRPLKT